VKDQNIPTVLAEHWLNMLFSAITKNMEKKKLTSTDNVTLTDSFYHRLNVSIKK
jgi:hypothetical protein